jgi:hypothetical protein
MKHIEKIDIGFDIAELLTGLSQILEICDWHPHHNQIGLTHSLGHDATASWHDATGSLEYEWGNDAFDENGQLRKSTKKRSERDFVTFVSEFNHTVWKQVYDQLSARYTLGRVRLMKSKPKSCLSWHRDSEKRLHIPVITNIGARLVIEDTANHLMADGSVYIADTTKYHTAFNAGLDARIHFVACVLD